MQEKGAVTPQETDPDLPVGSECPEVSSRDVGWQWLVAGTGALSVAVCAKDILREVNIILSTSTMVWYQVKQRRNTAPPINRKLF